MEYTYRPRLSRETRLLLMTAAVALATLLLLARLRFPDQPVTPNPMPPLLTQLAPRPAFDDLASAVADAQGRVESSLETFILPTMPFVTTASTQRISAVHLGDGRAVAWLPPSVDVSLASTPVVAMDAASRVAVLRTLAKGVAPVMWTPSNQAQPRYVIANDPSGERLAFRPVFIGHLVEASTSISTRPVWSIPPTTDVSPGTFLFTTEGRLTGLVLHDGVQLFVVPGSSLTALADRTSAGAVPVPDANDLVDR